MSPPTGGDAAQLRLASASCQHFETGFYAAHADIASWAPDLVVFLGDFIYEYGGENLGGAVLRSHDSAEPTTVDEYRGRYARYLADAQLQAARAACPWLVIWDDHEVENNYAGDVSEDAAPVDEFRRPTPRRLPGVVGAHAGAHPAADRRRRHDHLSHGPLGFARRLRPARRPPVPLRPGVRRRRVVDRPGVPGDGRPGEDDARCATRSDGSAISWRRRPATWPVIVQQTVLSDVTLPNGAVLNFDQWDGYPAARQRLLLQAAQTARTVVLTGDIHLAAVGVLPGVGVEFVCTSISSPLLVPPDLTEVADRLSRRRRRRARPPRLHPPHRHGRSSGPPSTAPSTTSPIPPPTVSTWKTFTVDAGTRDAVVAG